MTGSRNCLENLELDYPAIGCAAGFEGLRVVAFGGLATTRAREAEEDRGDRQHQAYERGRKEREDGGGYEEYAEAGLAQKSAPKRWKASV